MKIPFPHLALLLWVQAASPQSNAVLSCSNFIAGTFEPGATAYAFGDRLNIRREASTGGTVAAALKIGTPVEILSRGREEDSLEQRGLREPWYQVRGEAEILSTGARGMAKGWLWGGLLAKVTLVYDVDRDGTNEFLMLGFLSNQTRGWGKTAELRAIRGGKITQRLAFTVFDSPSQRAPRHTLWGQIFRASGLEPAPNLLRLGFHDPLGAAPSGEWLMVLDGAPLALAVGAFGLAAGAEDAGYRVLFPDQLYGAAGLLAVEGLPFEALSSTNFRSAARERAHYGWDGRSFHREP